MNHIYKVIWNKAKHCYTVVSEIAKSHSTSSVTKKKVSIAAILAAGMLSGFSPMVSGAVDNTQTSPVAAVVYNDDQTSLKSTNSGSVGKNAIALGKEASAVDNSIAIGNGASAVKGRNGVGKDAIALGNGASAVDDSIAIGNGASVVTGSNGNGGVALGKNASAGYKGTSLGNSAISGREGTIVIGDMTNASSLYSTVVGTNSTITTSDSDSAKLWGVNVQGAVSTSYGAHNTITNNTITNEEKVFSGVANSIIGSVNTVTNSNGVTIQGTGNTVTGAYKNMTLDLWTDLGSLLSGDYSVLTKQENGAIAIIGGANTISNQTSSTVIGYGNTLEGGENSTGVLTAGSQNTLTNVSNSLVMGDNNTLKDRTNVISLGNKNTVTANKAVAIGNGTTVEAEGGIAIGESSVAKGNHSTAIGNESNVDGDDGLVIGYKSQIIKGSLYGTTDATVLGNQSVIGNDSFWSTIIGSKSSISENARASTAVGYNTKVDVPWGTALGAQSMVSAENGTALGGFSVVAAEDGVAIGVLSVADRAAGVLGYLADTGTTKITWKANAGAVSVGSSSKTRQIINVAAGTKDTDAVNVAQLKKALESISTEGLTIQDGPSVTGDGIDGGNQKVTGVEAGEISSTSKDAVNGSQLHAVQQEAGKHTKVVNGSNITVEETDQDGQKTYKVGLNKDLLLGDITGKNVSISGTNGTIETTGFIATKDKIYEEIGRAHV